jgi:hypothetical protein
VFKQFKKIFAHLIIILKQKQPKHNMVYANQQTKTDSFNALHQEKMKI